MNRNLLWGSRWRVSVWVTVVWSTGSWCPVPADLSLRASVSACACGGEWSLYISTHCDRWVVLNVKGLPFLTSSSASIQSLTPDRFQSTCHVSPSSSSRCPLTHSPAPDTTWTDTELGRIIPMQETGGVYKQHVIPGIIKADLIKPVCIIKVFMGMLTGSRYSLLLSDVSPEARGILRRNGVMTETFVSDANQTLTTCVSWSCLKAYRKQSCVYQCSVHNHFKTSLRLLLSRSSYVCLSADFPYEEFIMHF